MLQSFENKHVFIQTKICDCKQTKTKKKQQWTKNFSVFSKWIYPRPERTSHRVCRHVTTFQQCWRKIRRHICLYATIYTTSTTFKKSNFIFLSYLSVVEPQEILDLIQFEGSKKFCKIYVYNSFRIIRGKCNFFFFGIQIITPPSESFIDLDIPLKLSS